MKIEEVKEFAYEALVEAFGKLNIHRREDGTIWLRSGSAIVDVSYSDGEAPLILIFSNVALNVPYSEQLIKMLLNMNLNLYIGCLGFTMENESVNIILRSSLIPEYTKKEELAIYVENIVKTADSLDDQIVNQFGGEKMDEFVKRIQKEMEDGKKIIN